MKRRLLALLMSLVMILSVLPGAAFAEPADSSDVLTYADLADIDSSITIPDGASASEELSVADAVRALLLWTGMSEKQLGTFPADYLALARSMGMISADTDTDAACILRYRFSRMTAQSPSRATTARSCSRASSLSTRSLRSVRPIIQT